MVDNIPLKHDTYDKKIPLNLYDQIIDDHIFTNVVSNKNTDFHCDFAYLFMKQIYLYSSRLPVCSHYLIANN